MTRHAKLLLVVLPLLSCTAPASEMPDSMPAPRAGEQRVEGIVRVVGSTPVGVSVALEPEDGNAIVVSGPLRDELRQLSGARVAVTGRVARSTDPIMDREIQAASYEIVSVDGQPVITGTIQGRMNDWTVLRTPTGETIYLSGAAAQFQPGQKVWVQGQRSMIVQTYGVLNP